MMKVVIRLTFLSLSLISAVVAQRTPCYICGDGVASTISNPSREVLWPDVLKQRINVFSLTCFQAFKYAEVDGLFSANECPRVQEALASIRGECGCQNTGPIIPAPVPAPVPPVQQNNGSVPPPTPIRVSAITPISTGNPPCYICGDGGVSTISNPDVVLPASPNLLNRFGVTQITCGELEFAAEIRPLLTQAECPVLEGLIAQMISLCGCGVGGSALQGNDPVVQAGVEVPVVSTPVEQQNDVVVNQGPSTATGNAPCYVCGDGGVSAVTQPNVVFSANDVILALFAVSELTCRQLVLYAETTALLSQAQCRIFQGGIGQIQAACGCPNGGTSVQGNTGSVVTAAGTAVGTPATTVGVVGRPNVVVGVNTGQNFVSTNNGSGMSSSSSSGMMRIRQRY